jgi:hypothetical protein
MCSILTFMQAKVKRKSSPLIHRTSQTIELNHFITFPSQKNVTYNRPHDQSMLPKPAYSRSSCTRLYTSSILYTQHKFTSQGNICRMLDIGSSADSCRPFFSAQRFSCDSFPLQQPPLCTREFEPSNGHNQA